MMLPLRDYTLDEIAQTSEGTIVRRRFDERNVAWTYSLAWLFAMASVICVGYSFHRRAQPQELVAMADAALTIFMLGALHAYRSGQGRWLPWARIIGRNLTPWIVTLFLSKIATFTFLALRGPGAFAWAMLFPFTTLGLRLLLGPRLILHGAIAAITIGGAMVPGKQPRDAGAFIALAFLNSAVFAMTTVVSRRLKRTTIAEWRVRRADARERLRIRDELQFAREVQVSMLPEAPPVLDWADVAGVSIPATEVGGDYYDYLDVGGRLAVVCADVAGHGLASGITLAGLRSGFTLLRDSLSDPSRVMERLQSVVLSSRKRMMVTVSVLLLDPTARRAIVASAGHPPIIVRREDRRIETIELFAPPLGARLGGAIPQRELTFAPGDVFVMHSDGVYETMSPTGEYFGLERLAAVVAYARGDSAQIRDAILRSVEEFRDGAPQEDDVTVVVVQIF
jgi:hypothetical protein